MGSSGSLIRSKFTRIMKRAQPPQRRRWLAGGGVRARGPGGAGPSAGCTQPSRAPSGQEEAASPEPSPRGTGPHAACRARNRGAPTYSAGEGHRHRHAETPPRRIAAHGPRKRGRRPPMRIPACAVMPAAVQVVDRFRQGAEHRLDASASPCSSGMGWVLFRAVADACWRRAVRACARRPGGQQGPCPLGRRDARPSRPADRPSRVGAEPSGRETGQPPRAALESWPPLQGKPVASERSRPRRPRLVGAGSSRDGIIRCPKVAGSRPPPPAHAQASRARPHLSPGSADSVPRRPPRPGHDLGPGLPRAR